MTLRALVEHLPDEDLVAAFRRSSTQEKAFRTLVQRYQQPLYRHIRHMGLSHEDADDLLQNVFLKAWQGLAGFRGESKLSTWLYKIATNETLSYLKLKRHKVMQPAGEQYDWMARQLRAAEPLDGEAIQAKLQAAMNQLPDRQRAVFQLRYFEDMTYAGMAEVLNRSEGALKASYHHAVKKLEKMLTGD